jgi:molecular chaperone GrpE
MDEENNEELEKELEEATQEVETEKNSGSNELNELNDRYKRLFAEFENYKKRTQKESLTKRAEITGDVVSSILPVMDNLEKAVQAQTSDVNFQEGIKLVVKQLSDVLEKFGMTEIETVGQKFDPELHEAVSHIDDPSKGDSEIVQEYRKGYKIGNKVVRHSMVIVAN